MAKGLVVQSRLRDQETRVDVREDLLPIWQNLRMKRPYQKGKGSSTGCELRLGLCVTTKRSHLIRKTQRRRSA